MKKQQRAYRFIGFTGALFAALLMQASSAYAIEISNRLSLNGFYSLDASLSQGNDVILPSILSDPITLKDGKVNFGSSLVGLQLDFTLTDRLRFAAQAIANKQTKEDYLPNLEWAYLTYDLNDDLSVRSGKLKTPLMQGIELRYVGFSRLWVRPLVPSSGAAGFDDYTGAEIIKKGRLGDYNLKFQGAYGVADHQQIFVDDRDVKLLSARIERDESWVNLALFHARYDVFNKQRTRLLQANAEVLMGSIEAEWLLDKTVLNAGYAYGDAEVNPDEQLAYLSLGYRLNRFTPYFLYQHQEMVFTPFNLTPPPGTNFPVARQKDGKSTTHSFSLGFRYDLGETQAIKAQVDRQLIKDSSDAGPGELDLSTTIFSVVFEGVF